MRTFDRSGSRLIVRTKALKNSVADFPDDADANSDPPVKRSSSTRPVTALLSKIASTLSPGYDTSLTVAKTIVPVSRLARVTY